jgi:hypothetical protein
MKNAVHFVRFTDTGQYARAAMVFGKPTFVHRFWDARAVCEVAEGDVVVFAQGTDQQDVCPYTYDDSAYF